MLEFALTVVILLVVFIKEVLLLLLYQVLSLPACITGHLHDSTDQANVVRRTP